MNSILKFIIPAMCCLSLMACKNNLPGKETGNPEEAISEITDPPQGVQIDRDYGTITLFTASDFNATDNSRKLKKLPYYKAPAPPTDTEDMIYIPDAINSLFPLGWSEEGNFAYAIYSIGYNGEHNINYLIRNMGTGDTLWRKDFFYEMVEDTTELYSEVGAETFILINGPETEEDLFRYTWLLNEKTVIPELQQAGIQFDPSATFEKQSNYGNITFEVVQTVENEDFFSEYSLMSNQFEPKVIYSDYFGRKPEIAGVIKSPYGETIAVVCWQKRQIHEMSNEIVPILSGYQLD